MRGFHAYEQPFLVAETIVHGRTERRHGAARDSGRQSVTLLVYLSTYRAALDHDFDIGRSNANWDPETRPILEAFWHCAYFLEQLARYGRELSEPSGSLPSGWAAVLELYGVR